jgi:hypothetical protein
MEDPSFLAVREACQKFEDVAAVTGNLHRVLFQYSRQTTCQQGATETGSRNEPCGECFSCGRRHSRFTCRYRSAVCHRCGKTGHIQSVCRSAKKFQLVNSGNKQVCKTSDSYDVLTLSLNPSVSHLYETLSSTSGSKHDFVIDTGSVESLISLSNLEMFYPNYVLQRSQITIRGVTGHSVPVLGRVAIPICNRAPCPIMCSFIVTEAGPSLLGLTAMRLLKIQVALATDSATKYSLKELIYRCSVATGGMKVKPVSLEVNGDLIFPKRRIIPYGLRDPVRKVLDLSLIHI